MKGHHFMQSNFRYSTHIPQFLCRAALSYPCSQLKLLTSQKLTYTGKNNKSNAKNCGSTVAVHFRSSLPFLNVANLIEISSFSQPFTSANDSFLSFVNTAKLILTIGQKKSPDPKHHLPIPSPDAA